VRGCSRVWVLGYSFVRMVLERSGLVVRGGSSFEVATLLSVLVFRVIECL